MEEKTFSYVHKLWMYEPQQLLGWIHFRENFPIAASNYVFYFAAHGVDTI